MVQQLVQGGLAGAGGGLVIGRQQQRQFRHDVPVDRDRGVTAVAGEFGAERARAPGASLLSAGHAVPALPGAGAGQHAHPRKVSRVRSWLS
ncbi:hypothetical protein [Streptomyces polygonati]|uniref:hypothetical protein n=1 Tax=Streptomyces polygonati TaxID=1617087 RepID=UPI0036D86BC1